MGTTFRNLSTGNIHHLFAVEMNCPCDDGYIQTLQNLFTILDKEYKITQKEIGSRKYAIQAFNHLAYLLSCE